MNPFKERIEQLVVHAETRQALTQLLSIPHIEEKLKQEAIALHARFEKLHREGRIAGIWKQEDMNIELNRIHEEILSFLQKLPDELEWLQNKRRILAAKLGIPPKQVIKICAQLEERYNERLRQKLDYHMALSLQLNYTQEGTDICRNLF